LKQNFNNLVLAFIFVISSIIMAECEIPSSELSRSVSSRLRPKLEEELSEKGLMYGAPIFLRIFKYSRELELWLKKGEKYQLFKTYRICTYGRGGLGPKLRQGDNRAPEGFYFVTPRRMNPYSKYHLSFNLGYPNKYDRSWKRTGSALMVHGNCVSIGCFAMTDLIIEEIYSLAEASLRKGQKYFRVHIFPFRMTEEKMEKYGDSRWFSFWENLKEGYEFFETRKVPPNVEVINKRYLFEIED